MYLFHKDCNGWPLDVLLHGVRICSEGSWSFLVSHYRSEDHPLSATHSTSCETFLGSVLAINLHNN